MVNSVVRKAFEQQQDELETYEAGIRVFQEMVDRGQGQVLIEEARTTVEVALQRLRSRVARLEKLDAEATELFISTVGLAPPEAAEYRRLRAELEEHARRRRYLRYLIGRGLGSQFVGAVGRTVSQMAMDAERCVVQLQDAFDDFCAAVQGDEYQSARRHKENIRNLTSAAKNIAIAAGYLTCIPFRIVGGVILSFGTALGDVADALDDATSGLGPSSRGPTISGPPGGHSGWHAGKHHGH